MLQPQAKRAALAGLGTGAKPGPLLLPAGPAPSGAHAPSHIAAQGRRRADIPAPGAPVYVPRGPLASSQREAPEALGRAARRVMADPEASVVLDHVVA